MANSVTLDWTAGFDPEYFATRYPSLFFNNPYSTQIEAYLQNVESLKCDPRADFSEVFYLELYDDVAKAVKDRLFICGYHHWQLYGRWEGRRAVPASMKVAAEHNRRAHCAIASVPSSRWEHFIDKHWYANFLHQKYAVAINPEQATTAFLIEGIWRGDVPTPAFDETFYIDYNKDVGDAKQAGLIPSGFVHYVISGENEGRVPQHDINRCLKRKLSSLAEPIGFSNLAHFEDIILPIDTNISNNRPPTINVFVPTLDPDIMFGGYIALLHFLTRAAELGARIRFIICEDGQSNQRWFLNNIRERWRTAFLLTEFVNLSNSKSTLVFNNDDICIAYSAWTAYKAHSVSSKLRNKRFIYFIQEDETIFHENNSYHFFISDVYNLPHVAIFNTTILEDYFREHKIGVFSSSGCHKYVSFAHALANVRPDRGAMSSRQHKSLFFYARAEGHAGRNLFEIGVLALRLAVAKGTINETWKLLGIGSLGANNTVDLGRNVKLEIAEKIPQDEYERKLQSFDVGLSLMWAPHPSIVPFELAKAGVVCVTNEYGSRTAELLGKFGKNIVAGKPTVEGIANALAKASALADNYDGRVEGSKFDWPTDWDIVFSEAFILEALDLVVQ